MCIYLQIMHVLCTIEVLIFSSKTPMNPVPRPCLHPNLEMTGLDGDGEGNKISSSVNLARHFFPGLGGGKEKKKKKKSALMVLQ